MSFDKNQSAYILRWSKKIRAVNILGGKCCGCGIDNIFVLEFHHRDASVKEREMGYLLAARWSSLEAELPQCVLMCGNCHQEIHVMKNTIDVRMQHLKADLLKHKGVYVCQKCGFGSETNRSLDFHHRVESSKDFGISRQVLISKSITYNILRELEKCDVLCRNCHELEHFDKLHFEQLRQQIYAKVDSYKEKQPSLDRKMVLQMYKDGIRQIDIAKQLKCAKSTICSIVKEGT